ncbi:MAG TPA: ABC transporter ATP-binding protein [Fibrobacteria bacterium]|nr:ABC transporter ATP-binding protein [Fibrobacteria bacterium]
MTSQETTRADARFVHLEGIHQVFGSGAARYHALDNVDLQIARGEFVSLIGHSGCGKSTLLNIVAGLAAPTHGHVLVGGREVDGPGLDRAVVFQSHSLLPWLSVVDNVRLAVDGKHPDKPRAWRKDEAMRLVEMVHLGAHAHKKPSEISGGMKQRVGIARAFAADPDVLLLDEPFGALDALTRGGMQDELNRIWESSRKTVIMITHDVDEAIFLSDRILLMSNGPRATVAEDVAVDIARPRTRESLLEDPAYAALRKKLVHYLISTGHARQAA